MNNQKISKRYVPCKDMCVDMTYQRAINDAEIKKIVKYWDNRQVRLITLSLRKDGRYYVINGNHTRTAAMIVNGEDTELLCEIYTGLTKEDEANLFYQLNTNFRKPTYNDLLKSRYAYGDDKAVRYIAALDRSCLPYSFTSHGGNGHYYFSSHKAGMSFLRIYGEDIFVSAASVLARVHRKDINSITSLGGLCRLLYVFPNIDKDKLIAKLSKAKYDEMEKLASGYGKIGMTRDTKTVSKAYSCMLAQIYNFHLPQEKRLDVKQLL